MTSRWQAACVLQLLLFPAVVLSAPVAPPSLEPERSGADHYVLSAGWRLCGGQVDGMQLLGETQDGRQIVEVPIVGMEDVDLSAGTPRRASLPRVAYVRVARANQPTVCRAVAFPIGRGFARVVGSGEAARAEASSAPNREAAARASSLQGPPALVAVVKGAGGTAVRLPSGLYACAFRRGTISADKRSITLLDVALPVESVLNVSSDESCANPERVLLIVDHPPPAMADLKVALDWRPSSPGSLRVFVTSTSLATDPEERNQYRMVVGGRFAQWDETCRGEVCGATVDEGVGGKAGWGTVLQPLVQAVPAGLEWGAVVFRADDGALLQRSSFPAEAVGRWLANPSSTQVHRSLLPREIPEKGQLRIGFSEPLLRFVPSGSYPAQGPADKTEIDFERSEFSGETAALVVNLDSTDGRRVRSHLLGAGEAEISINLRLPEKVLLVEPGTLRDIAKNVIRLTVRGIPCRFDIEQLTRAFAGLNGGTVLFRIEPKDEKCSPEAWTVSSPEKGIVLEPTFHLEKAWNGKAAVQLGVLKIKTAVSEVRTVPLEIKSGDRVVEVGGAVLRLEPALLFSRPKLLVDRSPPFGSDRAAPPPAGGVPSTTRIAIGRVNWISFDVPWHRNWVVHVQSPQVRPCHSLPAAPEGLRAVFREQRLCVVGEEPGTGIKLNAALVATAAELARPEASMPDSERGSLVSPGSQEVTVPFEVATQPVPLPLDLAVLSCGMVPDREIRSGEATRAVSLDGAGCVLRIPAHLPEARLLDHALGRECSVDDRRDVFSAFLSDHGRQSLMVRLRPVAADGTTSKETAVGPIELSFDQVVTERRDVRWRCQGATYWIEIVIDQLEAERARIAPYSEIDVAVTLSDASRAELPLSQQSSPPTYQARLRRMPRGGARLHAGQGFGDRWNLNFSIPVGLRRYYRGTGRAAASSDEFRKPEAASFGIGAIVTGEFWNFDRNEASLPLNPQLNVGVMASDDLSSRIDPYLSFVLGLGLRLPGSKKADASVDSHVNLFTWYEITRGARSLVGTILFGIGINIKALGE